MEDETLDDAELVRRISRGHQRDAEAELCRRFQPRARLYGLRHLRDEDRARDLAQAAVLTTILAVRAGRVEEPELIGRFMLGTCRNIARRMRDADARAEPIDPAEMDLLSHAQEPEPIDRRSLSDCLGKLDPRSFSIVMATFNAGVAAGDLATHVGTSVANVRVIRHRALAQLRRCLEREPEEGT